MATRAERDRQLTEILRANIVDDEPTPRPRRHRRASPVLKGLALSSMR